MLTKVVRGRLLPFGWRVRVLALARLDRRDVHVVARMNVVCDGERHRAAAVDDVVEDRVCKIESCGVEGDVVDGSLWLVLDHKRVSPNGAGPHRRRCDAVKQVVERNRVKDRDGRPQRSKRALDARWWPTALFACDARGRRRLLPLGRDGCWVAFAGRFRDCEKLNEF